MKQTLIGILSFINEVEQRLITFASTKIGKQIFGDIGEENQNLFKTTFLKNLILF